jgi:hypothetical protein
VTKKALENPVKLMEYFAANITMGEVAAEDIPFTVIP